MLTYKNYLGHVEFDEEAGILHGEVINTRDVITFQGETVAEIKQAFIASVEDYLAFCASRGEEPEKPFSGKFNLRLTPELHRKVYVAATHAGKSLNKWIVDLVEHAAQEAA